MDCIKTRNTLQITSNHSPEEILSKNLNTVEKYLFEHSGFKFKDFRVLAKFNIRKIKYSRHSLF